MKYYEIHEQCYQELKKSGKVDWSRQDTLDQVLDGELNSSLKQLFHRSGRSFDGLRVLDLGTGAGNAALFCAQAGSIVTAIDISPTAIEMANHNAGSLGLAVDFRCGDVLDFIDDKSYDLVIDSALLHCLVGRSDRKKLFDQVQRHLAPSGLFFVFTMVANSDMKFNDHYFFYDGEVLWSTGFPEIVYGRKSVGSNSYFPHRTIVAEEVFKKELQDVGFKIIHQKVTCQEGDPSTWSVLATQ